MQPGFSGKRPKKVTSNRLQAVIGQMRKTTLVLHPKTLTHFLRRQFPLTHYRKFTGNALIHSLPPLTKTLRRRG
jgi:hypothetical protein